MTLELSSKKFLFASSQFAVVLFAGDKPKQLRLAENRIENADIRVAGEYRLLLMGISIQRTRDHLQAVLPSFVCTFQVSDADLKKGRAIIEIGDESLYKITIMDREWKPVPDRELTCIHRALFDWGGYSDATVKADHTGSFLLLGNPFAYALGLDKETGLMIRPI